MAGATRLLLLLTAPFSFLHPRTSFYRLARLSFHPLSSTFSPHHNHPHHHLPLSAPRQSLHFTIKSSQRIHTQANSLKEEQENYSLGVSQQHPWPEWSKLVHTISSAAEIRAIVSEDEFVSYDYLSEEFVRSASACLAFARNRPDILGLLSRKDIEVIVENGSPFLFKSALDTGRRMRSFLGNSGINVLDYDKAHTVDLMKYLLSYASNPSLTSEKTLYSREIIESSVRYLLCELAEVSCRVPVSNLSAPEQHQAPGEHRQIPRPLGQNIEMKRGDWICPKCSFMNFARNVKCLECEEARPKRQLTGGEWECPQCDFFNYGRNAACLRCDLKRPGEASFRTASSKPSLGYNNEDYASKADIISRLPANKGNAQQLFDKVSQINDSTLPETNNKSFSEQGIRTVSSNPLPIPSSLQYAPPKGSNSSYVPFVPSAADMFAKNSQSTNMEDGEKMVTESQKSASSEAKDQSRSVSFRDEPGKSGENIQLSENLEGQAESQNKENEQAEKSERWFKKVAELHDVTDLASAISDEDFPEIMPMRKGENRFVISKKKDRSLTSPKYKRQMAMEQSNNSRFVPFVPFPPDYFAKKDNPQPNITDSTIKSTDGPYSNSKPSDMNSEKSGDAKPGAANVTQEPSTDNQQNNQRNWTSNYADNIRVPSRNQTNNPGSQDISNDRWNNRYSGRDNISNAGPPSIGNSSNTNENSSRYSVKENVSQSGIPSSGDPTQNFISSRPTNNLAGTTTQPTDNQNVRSGWTGKSLEGSAVKEGPDPLDMSEEAKAERWFRRVAQIKDISELSQIPDEDFPSIMPMRKGVNRFVVSKRKTPLERRLTSPQYRRNLPIVRSDPVKKESDDTE